MRLKDTFCTVPVESRYVHGVQLPPPAVMKLPPAVFTHVKFTQLEGMAHLLLPAGSLGAPHTPLLGATVVSLQIWQASVRRKAARAAGAVAQRLPRKAGKGARRISAASARAHLPRKLFRKHAFQPLLPTTPNGDKS